MSLERLLIEKISDSNKDKFEKSFEKNDEVWISLVMFVSSSSTPMERTLNEFFLITSLLLD